MLKRDGGNAFLNTQFNISSATFSVCKEQKWSTYNHRFMTIIANNCFKETPNGSLYAKKIGKSVISSMYLS